MQLMNKTGNNNIHASMKQYDRQQLAHKLGTNNSDSNGTRYVMLQK